MSSAETTEHAQSSGNVPATVIFSATLGKFVETIGKWGALFMLPLVLITVWDVLQRKTRDRFEAWELELSRQMLEEEGRGGESNKHEPRG